MTMFVETRAALIMRAAFDVAVKMRYPVLAVGKAGLGKTVALRWIADQSGAAYCEVAQHTRAIRPMFKMLHDAYGVQKDSKHTYDLAKDCMNFWAAGTAQRARCWWTNIRTSRPPCCGSCCISRSAAVSRCCSRVTPIG